MVTPDRRAMAGNRKPFSTEQAGLAYSCLESPEGNMRSGDCSRDDRCQFNNIRVFNDGTPNTQSNLASGQTGLNESALGDKNPMSPSS